MSEIEYPGELVEDDILNLISTDKYFRELRDEWMNGVIICCKYCKHGVI